MKTWRAKLVWSDKKRIPPAIPAEARVTYSAYCPIIVFEGQYDKPIWENRVSTVPLWSAVVFNEEVSGTESVAAVSYLSPEAPSEQMKIGAEFDLWEGGDAASRTALYRKRSIEANINLQITGENPTKNG